MNFKGEKPAGRRLLHASPPIIERCPVTCTTSNMLGRRESHSHMPASPSFLRGARITFGSLTWGPDRYGERMFKQHHRGPGFSFTDGRHEQNSKHQHCSTK